MKHHSPWRTIALLAFFIPRIGYADIHAEEYDLAAYIVAVEQSTPDLCGGACGGNFFLRLMSR
jgi:hypothetical protein